MSREHETPPPRGDSRRTLTDSPRIAVATPHQEASMLAIAQASARNGHLARMYTSLHAAKLQAALPKLPHRAVRLALEGQLARRSFPEIAPNATEPVAQISQALQSSRCASRTGTRWRRGSGTTRRSASIAPSRGESPERVRRRGHPRLLGRAYVPGAARYRRSPRARLH
jgi:hypothetical protein